MRPIFFFPGDSHTKGILFLLHLGLEFTTEVMNYKFITDSDPKGRFVSFKVTPSNDSSLFVPLKGIEPENSWLEQGRFYRCCSNCDLWKLIVDNGLEDLWRRENPDSPEFTCYDRSFAKGPVYTGSILISILIQKLLAIRRLITWWYPLLIIIMLFLLTGSPQKLKLEKIHDTLIIIFYVSPRSPQLQKRFFFY